MAGKDGSPSASSTFLPLAKQLRRASVTSITSLFDKQSLNQTLDQIHNSASQSETLTTFNDYTSPPPSTAVQKKSPDSAGGIGSWYSRMTNSVTSTKSNRSGQESVSRASTGRSGEAGAAANDQNGSAASTRDRASTSNSLAQTDILSDSHASLRAPSRRSQYSQAADAKSVAESVDGKAQPEPSSKATMSHKPGHSVSSQISTSQVSVVSAQDSRAESKQPPPSLKRAMTPDPSAPATPFPQDMDRSRASLNLLPGQSSSRTPSVSSSVGIRRPIGQSERRESARPAGTAPEASPTLSRFSSTPNVKLEYEDETAPQGVVDADEQKVLESARQERPGLPRNVPTSDALTELKRIKAQGLSSAASSRAQVQTVGSTLSQLKNKVLSRQYWMKDENAKDCFYCGDPFSTFRRKHHCRTCGQIFDAKCTSLISGGMFGQSGNIRVCKPCEGLVNGYDDSSDYTDDDTASIMTSRTKYRHGSKGAGDTSPVRPSTPGSRIADPASRGGRNNLNNFKAHLPSVISRRYIDDLKRTSGQYDDDTDKKSIRPASSRSLRSSYGMRPHTSHRRHHSKHLMQRNPRNSVEEKAPFYRGPDPSAANDRLPAFHSDNVIDPDLAAYLSDDGESEDDEQSIAAALTGGGKSDQSTGTHSAMLKRPRSRYGDSLKILTSSQNDADSASISSSKANTPLRRLRRRNVSFTGSALQNSPPKPQRLTVAAHQWSSPSLDGIAGALASGRPESVHMTRSISMQGPRAPPVELNNASLQHGRRLLRQMLVENSITNVDGWEKALMPILLRATDDVVPNVPAGDAINITNYVKLKKVPGGKMGDTTYISGVVFSKNLALKSMKRNILNPNILIITFALEYSRHEAHFMSLEPVIRQEKEYLQNLVNRIAALKPELLLVQRNVSGLALEMLDKAKIATAYNMKRSVLEAISRCCQTRIITSLDKLATQPDSHSSCESFYLKTFLHENRRKTYMYFSGCPRELGCTIVLRGGNTTTLRRIKRVSEFMLQAIYNLRLETSLMRDEFALIPHYGADGTIRYEAHLISKNEVMLPAKGEESRPGTANADSASILTAVHGDARAGSALSVNTPAEDDQPQDMLQSKAPVDAQQLELPDDIPAPTFYSDLVENQRTRILSTSPFVKFMQPYLLMRARESERRLMHLKRLLDQDIHDLALLDDSKPKRFSLITPEMINETVQGTSRKIREILHAVHESEYDKATHTYRTQTKQWEASVSGNADMFNPLSHQSITVLHSLISTATNIACSGPDVFTIRFYDDRGSEEGPEADCTLGQYVEDTCLSAGEACQIHGCNKRMYEHHRHYVHGEGRLEMKIERLPPRAPGLEEIPLMWSACRICGSETQTVPISTNTWNYSFGKYLELAFWSIPLKRRADICPHDLHHDHWRYFGFKNWAIRLQYDPINILEVLVPRTRITWRVVNDLKFKNENFRKAERRLNKFVASVRARLKSIRLDTLLPEKIDECKEEIERLNLLITADHQKVLESLQDRYEGSKFYEIVPFNRALRMLHEKAGEWDEIFADFADNFLPSEKDIKRLATIQVKKLLFGTEETSGSLVSPEDTTNNSFTDEKNSTNSPEEALASAAESRVVSEKTSEMAAVVVEETAQDAQRRLSEEKAKEEGTAAEPMDMKAAADPTSPVVQHLDLAVSSPTGNRSPKKSPVLPNESGSLSPSSDRTPSDIEERLNPAEPASDGAALKSVMSEVSQPDKPRISAIPRLAEYARRESGAANLPGQRSQSQPAHIRQLSINDSRSATAAVTPASPTASRGPTEQDLPETPGKPQRRLSQRLAGLRTAVGQSKIPRSVNSNRKDSKVSALAKHFEQLISREFQQERLRDKKKRAGRQRQAGAYQAAALKPVVEVYRDVQEAVDEGQAVSPPQETQYADDAAEEQIDKTASTTAALAGTTVDQREGDGFHAPKRVEDEEPAEVEAEEAADGRKSGSSSSSPIQPSFDGTDTADEPLAEEDIEDPELDVTRHKNSIMRMLTNFWAERSASSWEPLYYPLRDIDHIFEGSNLICREDEPSSLIALALDHVGYREQLKSIVEATNTKRPLSKRTYVEDLFLTVEEQRGIERSLLEHTGHHLNYTFERGPAKMQCKIFWAEQFEAVRKKCGVSERIVESLSRCLKWDSQGGKTKSVFLKTLDDRFVLKSLSSVETKSFTSFASSYFEFMSETMFHELPSLIAKMLGFFQVVIKDPVSGTSFDEYLLLMENVFYDRASLSHIWDLKGSMRNRFIEPSGSSGQEGRQTDVLLDVNLLHYIAENPLFAREHSKKLLRSSVYNDTLFLSKQNVMDYSMMLGYDEEKRELVVGIIDCIRKYTWDKKLETWVKSGKNRPTVTEPKDYKNRFREAINRYVMQTPDCWHFGLAQNLGYSNARTEVQMQDKEDDGVLVEAPIDENNES